ncbi:MAG: hypothetical protein LBB61_07825 [Treponema sp.]|jgi:hypothetical protein|nr:hypothetical protein [Treponema sp.]
MSDWLPRKRVDTLAMCRAWVAYITAELRTLWGIPAEEWTALQSLFTAAEAVPVSKTTCDRRQCDADRAFRGCLTKAMSDP